MWKDSTKSEAFSQVELIKIGMLFLLPIVHPMLIPFVGAPSHLLWWVHVLPVALLSFRLGPRTAVVSVVLSAALVSVGEWMFGLGYGLSAERETILAVAVALSATNALVAWFALYARRVTARHSLLFDRLRMGVLRVSEDGLIVKVNPAAAQILRHEDPETLRGVALTDILHAHGVSSIRDLSTHGTWTGQLDLNSRGGKRSVHGFLAVSTLPDADGYQVLIADRSTEVMQEQEFERKAKLASLGEGLAGVAHELNNPLAAIVANVQVALMDEALDEEVRETFDIVNDQALRMRDLIRELLGFSRVRPADACASLDDVLGRILRVQRVMLSRRIRLESRIEWRGRVRMSATKIEQIVSNLVSNAAHALTDGGGGEITVSTSWRDGNAEVEVRDDGPGISPGIMSDLFQPFTTTKPDGEGTGLGLAISRRLARSRGGDLVARNLEPRGAAFTLVIPAVGSDEIDCLSPGQEALPTGTA